MFEWLDSLSPWWYAAGAAFVLSVAWMIYECQHAPTLEEDELERTRLTEHPNYAKNLVDQLDNALHQLTILKQANQNAKKSN